MQQSYQMRKGQRCITATYEMRPNVFRAQSGDVHIVLDAQGDSLAKSLVQCCLQQVGDHDGSVQKKNNLFVPGMHVKASSYWKNATHSLDTLFEGVVSIL